MSIYNEVEYIDAAIERIVEEKRINYYEYEEAHRNAAAAVERRVKELETKGVYSPHSRQIAEGEIDVLSVVHAQRASREQFDRQIHELSLKKRRLLDQLSSAREELKPLASSSCKAVPVLVKNQSSSSKNNIDQSKSEKCGFFCFIFLLLIIAFIGKGCAS